MKSISLDITKAAQFLSEGAVKAYEPQVIARFIWATCS